MRDFRNRPHAVRAKVRYYNNILTVSTICEQLILIVIPSPYPPSWFNITS